MTDSDEAVVQRLPEQRLEARCTLSFDVSQPTPMVFMLRPQSGDGQQITLESFELTPVTQVTEFTDAFGNLCQRLLAVPGSFTVDSIVQARVNRDRQYPLAPEDAGFIDIPDLPDAVLVYLLPSRYCESDRFSDMAIEIVGGEALGFAQVTAICRWVSANISNIPLSSTYPVSAVEVNQRGEGVCRDLAHLAICLCRALCIPARLAVGYLHGLDPMDNHAWFEAYVGDRWYTFDPAAPASVGARIVVARGRDAADVAIYNQYGPLLLPTHMTVSVEEIDEATA
ncbi:MAG: transglutaminase family protein [Halieaceae bacterium]